MQAAPNIDWDLALRVSAAGNRDLPDLPAPELQRLVADLRVTARRAGALVAGYVGIDSHGAGRIKVVDWAGWGAAVRGMVEHAVTELALPAAASGPLIGARRVGNGLLVGAGLKLAARRLLGQYDAYTGSDTLYLVAPTILAHERTHAFHPADFRLWVSLHEQTHALQFRAAPWLRGWIGERATTLFSDDSSTLQGLAGWARSGDVASLLATGPAGEALGEVVAAMTFLEGHADHTADSVGRTHIASLSRLRRAFTRGKGKGISRLLDKQAQYRDGLEFCKRVSMYRGRRALLAAFEAPANLPTAEEITAPRAWLDRVHG